MKTKITIPKIYRNRLTAQKASYLKPVRKLILCLIFGLFFLSGVNAQTIMSYKSGLQSLDPSTAAHLQSLVTDIYPSANLCNGELITYGNGSPVVAICDATTVNMLYDDDPTLSQLELIRITVNSTGDLPSELDFTRMQGLTELKYVLFVFAYDTCGGRTDDCLGEIVNRMIKGDNSILLALYTLSIPD
jgi:hypothetical protein